MEYSFDDARDRRGTNSVKWDRYPPEYLPFFIADMDFPIAPPIAAALERRIREGVFGYEFPGKKTVNAVTSWFRAQYGHEIDADWLVWLPGLVPALNVACSMADDGAVLTTTPNYSMLLSAATRAGKRRVDVPLTLVGARYEIDFDALEASCPSDARVFLLCNPHNPTGRHYTLEELERIGAFCDRHDLLLVSDEIHCEIAFDRPHIPAITVNRSRRDRTITLMSPAKICNMPSLPIAFAIIPDPEVRKSFQDHGYALAHPGSLEYAACAAAYSECDDWKAALLSYLRGNRDLLEREIAARFPGAIMPRIEATAIAWIDFRPLGIRDPHAFFLENAKVALSDGKGFSGEGFVRLNFGCRRAMLLEALERMERAIKR
jgi:cystathionine beta-lyase